MQEELREKPDIIQNTDPVHPGEPNIGDAVKILSLGQKELLSLPDDKNEVQVQIAS